LFQSKKDRKKNRQTGREKKQTYRKKEMRNKRKKGFKLNVKPTILILS
jgi:hypothetical protein